MKKMVTLLAAALIVASPFAVADTNGSSNDVLQQVQPTQNGAPEGQQVADASSTAPSDAAAASSASSDMSSDAAKPAPKHKHHKKHCKTANCKAKKHHHKKKAAKTTSDATPATDAGTAAPASSDAGTAAPAQ